MSAQVNLRYSIDIQRFWESYNAQRGAGTVTRYNDVRFDSGRDWCISAYMIQEL